MAIEFPQEVVDEIIDHLADDKMARSSSLQGSSLVSSQWLYRSQKHLFRKMRFSDASFSEWCKEIQPGDDGPSLHVIILHYSANFARAGRLAKHHLHLSSFTNLQKLRLHRTLIHDFTTEELSMCFDRVGCNVRSVSLRACKLTICSLVAFLRHFTKLERLSIIDPIVHDTMLDDSVESPILGGILELRDMFPGRGTRDFLHRLSLLPLAFHTVVLKGIHISLLAPVNELLATCRGTLARVDIRDHFVRNISLSDCDSLREIYLNAEIINHLPSIIRTVASHKLQEVRFILSDQSLERQYLDEWELIDGEICALVDRIQAAGHGCWKLSLRFVITSAIGPYPVGMSVAQLLPASSQHECIAISTDRTR